MDEEGDPDIGSVVGFQTDDMMYIATIISIDDDTDQFTVRTEDGQELTGPWSAAFPDPEKRMDELNDRYEPLGGGMFREKPREARSKWTPVPDPSWRAVALTAGGIGGVVLAIAIVITVTSFGAILTQIDSGNWNEVEGDVVEAYEGEDCSSNQNDPSNQNNQPSCTSYTAVTVAYTYEGKNYTTQDYNAFGDNWVNTAEHWQNKASVSVYVNPEQPSQAFHVQGWDGVLEEASVLFVVAGIGLGGYLLVFVPVWFVYAKIQRISGIEAPGQKKVEKPAGDESPREEKFW